MNRYGHVAGRAGRHPSPNTPRPFVSEGNRRLTRYGDAITNIQSTRFFTPPLSLV
jgi:hypothetical protein